MIEDEKREGKFVTSNFQVLADQQAEQNYAVNIYKGSGEMSGMLGFEPGTTWFPRAWQKGRDNCLQ